RLALILGVERALDDLRPLPVLADPRDALPGDSGVEIAADPADILVEPARLAQPRLEIAEAVRAAAKHHVPQPARMGQRLAEALAARVGAGEAGMDVAVARSGHGQVDGEDQGRAARLLRHAQQLAHIAAV